MKTIFLAFLLLATSIATAQVSEQPRVFQPVLGAVEHREARILVNFEIGQSPPLLYFRLKGQNSDWQSVQARIPSSEVAGSALFLLQNLEMAQTYEYKIRAQNEDRIVNPEDTFRTKTIWEYRTDPPAFNFLLGSCFYINDTPYDRPGKPYGGPTKIVGTMATHKADFMIWGGDNLYLREADETSRSGIHYRYQNAMLQPQMEALRSARMNLAIWDDHDFGPNDSDRSNPMKAEALDVFKSFWPNPAFGTAEQPGAYCKYKYSDCEFFLLDDRSFRSPNRLEDSIAGQPNLDKDYLGQTQLTWLLESLLNSKATFKFVVNGNQVLNPINKYEALRHAPKELVLLQNFIAKNKINGVIFLSGDRHHTELISVAQPGGYPLMDFTCSPVTSGTWTLKPGDEEFGNPFREAGSLVEVQNYADLSIAGPRTDRTLTISVLDESGKELWRKSIKAKSLEWPK